MNTFLKKKYLILSGVVLLVCIFRESVIGQQSFPFVVTGQKSHTELIDSPEHDYTITLGGTVDMDNTTTRGYPLYEVAFQPNISLEIENTGETPVEAPRIVINGLRDWRTIDSMIAEAVRGAANAQDSLFMLYEFARSNRYHDRPLFQGDELHDPVKHFNMYAAGFCDDIGRVMCALAYGAGFTQERHGSDPMCRSMHGHVMSEVALNGRFQFLDTDENAFYLDPVNERPVSGDEIVRDSDLVSRDYTYGPLFRSWTNSERAPALLGRDDTMSRSITLGHEMRLTLKPGEKLTLRWDNIGKTPGPGTLKHYANSFLDYVPELNEYCIDNALESRGVSADDGALVADSDAYLVFEVKSPYVICGGHAGAQFENGSGDAVVTMSVSSDGESWSEVWSHTGKGDFSCDEILDDSLGVKGTVPVYRYLVRFEIQPGKGRVRLTSLHLHTDLLASFISLPRLSLGRNSITYTDNNQGSRNVRITHTYRESSNIAPPQKPVLVTPADGALSKDAWITFVWNDVSGAEKYHLRVSKRPDLKTSYRPCYDVVIDSTAFVNPRTGLFNPGEMYYWSVRARNSEGVWGGWSPVRSFSWSGPCPPIELKTVERDGKLYLTWQPNDRGKRPVRYEVYASDIKGFKPCKTPYTVLTLGEVPSNFVGETTETEQLIVSFDAADEAPNKSSYRVIAIDENGTPGGSSWPLELPHPFVYSRPVTEVKSGEQYKYRAQTLQSYGDLQYRYEKPGYAFWEREGYEFMLTDAPGWLKMDTKTGMMSGKPGEYDTGKTLIVLEVSRRWPHELTTDNFRPESFTKDGSEFQSTVRQVFELIVKQ